MELNEVKAQFEEALKPLHTKLADLAGDLEKEKKSFGTERTETKQKVDQVLTEIGEVKGRVGEIEKKITSRAETANAGESKTAGQFVAESEAYKAMGASGSGRAQFKIPAASWMKTAIVNATGQNQPLVPSDRRAGIVGPNLQRLTIRDILPATRTSSNLIEYTREASFTNNAASQGAGSSPQVYENVAKAESAMTFELLTSRIVTLAHFVPASKQVLSDAPMLQGYIDGRLRYGLKLVEEDQLLNGTGSGANLDGLINQATGYDTGLDVAGDTKIDTLRHVILQQELAFHEVNAFVLSPADWHDIELKKDAENRYIWASPSSMLPPTIWGRRVVSTSAVDAGDFLAGGFTPDVVELYDREDVSVIISTEHSDFFVKNMVAILCEERLGLVVYKPLGLVTGSYPASA